MDLQVATLDQLPDDIKQAIVEALAPNAGLYRAIAGALAARLGGEVFVTKEEIDALAEQDFSSYVGRYQDGVEIAVGPQPKIDAAIAKHEEYLKDNPCDCAQCQAQRAAEANGQDGDDTLRSMIFHQALMNVGDLPN